MSNIPAMPTKEQWQAYILVAYQGLSYRQASERLNSTQDAIRMRLNRLKRRFPSLSFKYTRS